MINSVREEHPVLLLHHFASDGVGQLPRRCPLLSCNSGRKYVSTPASINGPSLDLLRFRFPCRARSSTTLRTGRCNGRARRGSAFRCGEVGLDGPFEPESPLAYLR